MCGEKFNTIAFSLADSPIADSYHSQSNHETKFPLKIYNCRHCGQLQLKHIVSPDEIYEDYIYWTKTSPDLQKHFKEYAKNSIKIANASSGLVVDVGCNDGTLLKNYQEQGFQIFGIEPAKNIAKYLTEINLPHINSYMNEQATQQIFDQFGSAKIITCNNVFANVEDTDSFMRALKIIMDANSSFIVEANYLLDMLNNQVFDYIYHEHLSYFSLNSLNALCARHAMEIYDVQFVNTKGGSFRSYIRLIQDRKPISKTVKKHLALETLQEINKPEMYQTWMKSIEEQGVKIKEELTKQKKMGKNIIGYGASATVTTLIHHFDLAELFDYFVDDNEIKHNTYCPSTDINVYSSDTLLTEQNAIIAITSWRFSDLIVDKNKELTTNNRFLRIFPTLSYF